jgi:hypothetical protein
MTAIAMDESLVGTFRYRKSIKTRPPKLGAGQMFCAIPSSFAQRGAEEALIVSFMCDRKLFGLAYWKVQPDYFDQMPLDSGVFIAPLIRTRDILSQAERPGDIDVLVIPYEGDELILERVLAIEVKAIRARFSRQGKSPNEFGFSQALSLLNLGFPYVAVAHLIISDSSPEEYWKEMLAAEVLDREGNAGPLSPIKVDPMPHSLTDRTFGRLQKHSTMSDVGLISAYIFSAIFGNCDPRQHRLHFPSGREASLNPEARIKTLDAVAMYFQERYSEFLDTPRYDPP